MIKKIIFLVVLLGGVFIFLTMNQKNESVHLFDQPTLKNAVIQKEVVVEYLKNNISILSPEKEVLGGTFYVTNFTDTGNNSGIVEYEDGHNAYKAKASYSIDDKNRFQIDLFEIIE